MGMRKVYEGRITHVGPRDRHRYEQRDGFETCTGVDHLVQMVVEVTDGPDKGREVVVAMSPEEFRSQAREIFGQADVVDDRRREREWGALDQAENTEEEN
jgi:hypothetical protein